jgi:hypothetical protein
MSASFNLSISLPRRRKFPGRLAHSSRPVPPVELTGPTGYELQGPCQIEAFAVRNL